MQDLIVKGKLLLEKPQANMMINTDPFPEAPINMIDLMWADIKERGTTWEIKVESKSPWRRL